MREMSFDRFAGAKELGATAKVPTSWATTGVIPTTATRSRSWQLVQRARIYADSYNNAHKWACYRTIH